MSVSLCIYYHLDSGCLVDLDALEGIDLVVRLANDLWCFMEGRKGEGVGLTVLDEVFCRSALASLCTTYLVDTRERALADGL